MFSQVNNMSISTVLSSLGFVLMALGLVVLYLTGGLLSPSPIVISFQIAAILLMVWARITFGSRSFHFSASPTQGGLVTTGPYHYVRHPIYTAGMIVALAGIAGNWSITNALLGFVVLAGGIIRILCEEHLLLLEYPEYTEYSTRTSRIIPFVF